MSDVFSLKLARMNGFNLLFNGVKDICAVRSHDFDEYHEDVCKLIVVLELPFKPFTKGILERGKKEFYSRIIVDFVPFIKLLVKSFRQNYFWNEADGILLELRSSYLKLRPYGT